MSTKLLAPLALAASLIPSAHAADPQLPGDGWAGWQVAAVENAPAWCCFSSWNARDPAPMSCKLDTRMDSYGTRDNDATTDAVRVYAKMAGGKIERLQALAANCPVETKTPIQQLDVSPEDSVRWLSAQARGTGSDTMTGQPLGESALAALAMHRGDAARDAIAGFARDPRAETRKWSVFWLSMLRGTQGADVTSSVMFADADSEVREHAAFALSQSKAPRVVPDLIRLGNTDKSGEVRSRAWFWLAQAGAQGAEGAITAALVKDTDADVREQAVFALSRLPDERATRALIAVAEDRSQPREMRKRAVFWLSQSESQAAQAYLEKVLARNAR